MIEYLSFAATEVKAGRQRFSNLSFARQQVNSENKVPRITSNREIERTSQKFPHRLMKRVVIHYSGFDSALAALTSLFFSDSVALFASSQNS